jgi:hypothetical protein
MNEGASGSRSAVIAPGIVLVATYGLYFLFPNTERLATQLGSYFPFLTPRLSFLREHDYASYLAYAASVLGVSISIPTLIALSAAAYWKVGAQPRKCKKVSGHTGLLIVIGILVCYVFSLITFLHVPQTYSAERPGMAQIFFWPFFPCTAAIVASTLANLLFSIIIGIIKLTILRGTNNG